MKLSSWFFAGALAAAIGVAIGAFGAHGLPKFLEAKIPSDANLIRQRIGEFETGVRYHMYQAFGLVSLGLLNLVLPAERRSKWIGIAGWMFVASIVLFSGLLYLLVVLNQPKLGMIVPIGGLAAIGGWACLALAARGK
jgi:uncharacterized membrane protein YgdD (TMEM256/DUF423 family)